jgi:membrane fusion protein, copper/silver efflux system
MKYSFDIEKRKQFYSRHRKTIVAGLLAGVFFLGFFFHWRFFHSPESDPKIVETTPGIEEAKPTFWTCSMHPNIRQPKPGKCPICGMDLIPVTTSAREEEIGSLRQITLSKAARELAKIQTTQVERRFVTAEVRMVGKVAYDETRLGYITAWIPGRLDRLFVDYTGVAVNKGDHMVYMYSPELYATQEELITAVKSMREQKDEATTDFFAVTNLIESARERLRLWGLTQEQIGEIEKREKPSDHVTIYAPMGGIVIEKLRLDGDYVNIGDRIYTIADLSQIWVMLDAYASDLMWLRYGQKIIFTTEAYPGERFIGQIAFISPILNDRTRTVKVRVNVPNQGGKLKPDMFVRGIVRAQVAAGGRVMDTALAGKWICPMHPEVIEDQSGVCNRCSMALVTAESLGYVSVEEMPISRHLVIPVSAALVTGTRAVVYVEIPGTEMPTFEGREIVLGPRAGDYYLVKTGLNEGEIVVTNGNMKIDSAVQIQAKPSMMTPEGGGGDMHHHGPKTQARKGEQPGVPMGIPSEFHVQLQGLEAAYESVSRAIEARNINQIHASFEALGEALNKVNGELLAVHPRMLWKEFSMLLNNDVVEGREVKQLKEADRIFQLLKRHMLRVLEQFGVSHINYISHPPRHIEVSAEFQTKFGRLFDAYVSLQAALARDDSQAASRAIPDLQNTLTEINADLLSVDAHHIWTDSIISRIP